MIQMIVRRRLPSGRTVSILISLVASRNRRVSASK